MELRYNVTGEARKALVKTVSELTGEASVYNGAPTFAFSVGGITISRDGALSFDESAGSMEEMARLVAGLTDRGFATEDSLENPDEELHDATPADAEDVVGAITSNEKPGEADEGGGTVDPIEAIKLYEEASEPGDAITAYYLLMSPADASALSRETLGLIMEKADKYIICADQCYLSEEEMEGRSIEFRKLPRDLNLLPDIVRDQVFTHNPEYIGQCPEPCGVAESDGLGKLSINFPLAGFAAPAQDNLEKLVASKAWILKKMAGTDGLPIERDEKYLRFPWFKPDASSAEVDAYSRLIAGLCETAKEKKRVMARERQLEDGDNEKFKARCMLLALGFIGKEYAQARKILLAPMSGGGSFKSGSSKKKSAAVIQYGGDTVQNPADAVTPLKCGECLHHCYYTDGLMRNGAGDIVDTSRRSPGRYTHYCLGVPSGYRKLKHAADWTGSETAAKWCPMSNQQKATPDSAPDCAMSEPDSEANAGAADARTVPYEAGAAVSEVADNEM